MEMGRLAGEENRSTFLTHLSTEFILKGICSLQILSFWGLPFSERIWCTEKQNDNNKSCFSDKRSEKIVQVYLFTLESIISQWLTSEICGYNIQDPLVIPSSTKPKAQARGWATDINPLPAKPEFVLPWNHAMPDQVHVASSDLYCWPFSMWICSKICVTNGVTKFIQKTSHTHIYTERENLDPKQNLC